MKDNNISLLAFMVRFVLTEEEFPEFGDLRVVVLNGISQDAAKARRIIGEGINSGNLAVKRYTPGTYEVSGFESQISILFSLEFGVYHGRYIGEVIGKNILLLIPGDRVFQNTRVGRR